MWVGGVNVVAVVCRVEMGVAVAVVVPCAKAVVDVIDVAHGLRLCLKAA